MELSRLNASLNAYTNLPGGNGQVSTGASQTGRSAENEAVSRTGEVEPRRAGSSPAPESTRVSLSQQGLEKAAAEAQSNQQATVAAQVAATGGVTAVSASSSVEADNPRSSVSSVQDTPAQNARETRQEQAERADNKSYQVPTDVARARNESSTSESEMKAQQRTAEERAQTQQVAESNRARARQDAPSFAQSGVTAYQGVANY